MSRLLDSAIVAAIVAIAASPVAGCQGAEPTAEPRAGRAPAQVSGPSGELTMVVGEVRAEPGIDPAAVQKALSEAETALLWCADPDGSTGVLSLRLSIERDGAVGSLRLGEATTYGSEDARGCVQRIVGAMRFTPPLAARAGVDVLLEVRPRGRALSRP